MSHDYATMTRERIGRWPLVVEVETVEDRFRFKVREQDRKVLPYGFLRTVNGGIRFRSYAVPGLGRLGAFLRGTSENCDHNWSGTSPHWPASRLPEFRSAVEQLVEELRAEHPELAPESAEDLHRAFVEELARKHATGRSPEAADQNSARTSSPGRPGERPTYCSICGAATPCGRPDHVAYRQVTASEMGRHRYWPTALNPKARSAWHAEHNPTERPPSDHEMEHVSVRGPATADEPTDNLCVRAGCDEPRRPGWVRCAEHDDEVRAECGMDPLCTAAGCDRTRKRGMLYCDPCGGRITSVDPYNLTKWPPVEDEPEEELSGGMTSSARDSVTQERARDSLLDHACDIAANMATEIAQDDIAQARREYARLGELLRELEGES